MSDAPERDHAKPGSPWAALEQRDYAAAVAGLRSLHCPEETIQDLMALRLARDFQDDLLTRLDRRRSSRPWWRADPGRESRELARERSALNAELRRQFESAVGVSFEVAVQEFFPWKSATGGNPIDPVHQAAYDELLADQRAEVDAIHDRSWLGGILDPADRAELAALKERHQEEIRRLLSPAELERLELRNGPAALAVRELLPTAATESQFQRLVQIARESGFSDPARLSYPGQGDLGTGSRQREEAARQLRERAAQELGAATFAELERQEQQRLQEEARRETERARATLRDRAQRLGGELGVPVPSIDAFLAGLDALRSTFDPPAREAGSGSPSPVPDETAARAQLESLARQHFGQQAGEFLRRMEP